MGEEVSFLAKYAPYYIPILSAIILIIFTKNYLFRGMISADMHKEQVDREGEIVKVQENVSNRLEEIVRQLESLTKKVSEEIRENSEVVRELSSNCEKHRKNIPDTVEFKQPRK